MTKAKSGVSRHRWGKWSNDLADPVRIPHDATPEQQWCALLEIDRRIMQSLANRYGIDINGAGGWMMLAYSLAADCVPGIDIEHCGRNQPALMKDDEYWRDLALAQAWAERSIATRGSNALASKFLAAQMQQRDVIPIDKRARQIQNDFPNLPVGIRAWARNTLRSFFTKYPERDTGIS